LPKLGALSKQSPYNGAPENFVTNIEPIGELREVLPPLTRPDNFFAFWRESIATLARQKPDFQVKNSSLTNDGLTLQWLTFRSLGGRYITAYCLAWNDGIERPLVVTTHGYIGQCEPMHSWAQQGLNVFGFDVRGFGRSRNAVPNPSTHGVALSGIQSPATSVLRGAVCDFVRAREVAEQMLPVTASRVVYYGASFAGALAMMAASVASTPDLLLAAVPTFGWLEGRRRWVRWGSGREVNRYLESNPDEAERTIEVLRYFDTVNFADGIRCPTLVGVGLADEVVPAPTVYAIVNHLSCLHEVREFPVSHSNAPESALWQEFERECIELSCHGTPTGFGQL
jgi:cephalosporin-C deacetylase